ncbi:MAG: hypothetical protein ACJAT7_001627 [Psychromonas sp.]|jgi:hypothetical protein|uniref:hypothetical protein n=1 Tax=Psychromonas sp. TaxID=1884585 RepID=UPI0039E68CE8
MPIYKLHQTLSNDFHFENIVDDLPDADMLVIITHLNNETWLQNPDVIRKINFHKRLANYNLECTGMGVSEYAPQHYALVYRQNASSIEKNYQQTYNTHLC